MLQDINCRNKKKKIPLIQELIDKLKEASIFTKSDVMVV